MTRRIILAITAVLTLWPAIGLAHDPPTQRQYWMGELATNAPANPTLAFLITLWKDGEAWRGTLDIPPSVGISGAWSVDLLSANVTPERIEASQPSGKPELPPNQFVLVRDPPGGDIATGQVVVSGSSPVPARIWRVTQAESRDFMPRRPQTPRSPKPYSQQRVEVPNTRDDRTANVPGVLTLPDSPGPHPVVILVNAFDVFNEDHASMGHKPWAVLADRLARAGIASLRTADRPLQYPGAAPHVQLTIEQLGKEAAQRISWVGKQHGVDKSRIALLGMNEGAAAAAIAADHSPDAVKCLVMLAPLATTGIQQFRSEFAERLRLEGETPDFIERRTASFMKPNEMLIAGEPEADIIAAVNAEITMMRTARRQQVGEASPDVIEGMAQRQYQIINQPAFREALTFDPAEFYARLKLPVLAILGGKDVRFSATESQPVLERTLGQRDGVETIMRTGPNLNYRLQPAVSGSLEEVAEIELTFDESVISDVIDFISRNLSHAPESKEGGR